MVGLPGCGKSTLAKKMSGGKIDILSSDEMRAELGTGEDDQSVSYIVFKQLQNRLVKLIENNKSVIVDSTNLSIKKRKFYIEVAKKYNVDIYAYYFELSLSDLILRNIKRKNAGGRCLDSHILSKLLTRYVRPSVDEGFTKVIKVTP